jgi:hypothetical protein
MTAPRNPRAQLVLGGLHNKRTTPESLDAILLVLADLRLGGKKMVSRIHCRLRGSMALNLAVVTYPDIEGANSEARMSWRLRKLPL